MQIFKRSAPLLLLVSAVACGSDGSPSSPSAPSVANIAGNYAGTFSGSQVVGGSFTVPITMSLTQAGSAVNGTYSATGAYAIGGTVSGTVSSHTFSGTFTRLTKDPACQGTFSVSGSADGTTVSWASPGESSNCGNPFLRIMVTAHTEPGPAEDIYSQATPFPPALETVSRTPRLDARPNGVISGRTVRT